MVRRPAAVADALFLLVVVFQGIARAGAAEDAAAPPAVVPPPRHRKHALAAEAGLRGGVGDPELVSIVGGAHRFVFARLDCSAQLHWNWLCVKLLAHRWRSRALSIKACLCCCGSPSLAAVTRALPLWSNARLSSVLQPLAGTERRLSRGLYATPGRRRDACFKARPDIKDSLSCRSSPGRETRPDARARHRALARCVAS